MPNDNWSDEEIENLLRDFPKIHDRRPKAEVYKKLSHKEQTQRSPKRWLPLLVAIVAFLSISVLVASLLQQNGTDSSSGETESSDAESTMATDETQTEQADGNIEESDRAASLATEDPQVQRSAVYESDLEDAYMLRIGLAYHGYVVPVSFVIPTQLADMAEPTALELYETFSGQIDESELGFDDYHPYEGELQQNGSTISHFLPDSHTYDQGSASTLLYLSSLEETFMDQQEIRVLNEDGEAAQLSHMGTVEPLVPGEQGQSFYLLESSAGEAYLAPAYGMSPGNVKDALLALQQSPNDDYRSPVPEGVSYRVEVDGANADLIFEEQLDLETLDKAAAMQMIESMALTAKSYGSSLMISNTIQSEWAGFDFSKELELPVSPNRIDWPEK
ncbi:hypothetical protein KQ939_03220 [Planococcus sp. CP5-4]|uniref:hypothetical protein n=1 Tax=unclassified Planococcus (in: firmicutes) TaxID=2662419 RepID=UPI001C218C89|nr:MULTISPECIES: hypothetical protein [unclassified Planococcus (in: firmicutes)]MBU9671990.1 hypothetical protein [Planococcus sp. CP5-4_YE]MBV0907553.1 hypothetical protein [Planococcus sp. CP5-4_UN]MBW6062720.1 hypothetical protein [Planococcus sp. CP5-4]